MTREALWKALAEATDAAQAATHEHAQEATPQARAAAEAAMQEYVNRLAPVIGGRGGVMGDERFSCLPDPLERRLLTACRPQTGCPS